MWTEYGGTRPKSGRSGGPPAALLFGTFALRVAPELLADLLVLIHFAFVLFVAAGGLLALRWPRLAFAHVPAALWGAWIEFSGGICPLTPMEKSLRAQAGQSAYAGDFVSEYVVPLLYPAGLTQEAQLGLGALVVGVNLIVYAAIWRRRRRSDH
jgi:hypothetical protein